jgi:N utilization substance protein B
METRKIDAWTLNDDYILLLLNAIKASKFYTYMSNAALLRGRNKQQILFMEA